MGKHTLREDKICLNCEHVVEQRFCPNCGQENKHTKESFHYLFTHFVEDLTHYDSSFWKTIKHLLFNPAKLTKEYLAGKRQSYVPPVKLYIFISFVTFFLLSVLPVFQNENHSIVKVDTEKKEDSRNKKISDVFALKEFKNTASVDSIQKALPKEEKYNRAEYWLAKKIAHISENNTFDEFKEKLMTSIFHNLPKVIFLYLPIFAFILWLFHNKKRWYYFEHGVFTFHYFSMLLLSFSLFTLLSWVLSWFGKNTITENISSISSTIMLVWWIFYFFRSHRRMYLETKFTSGLKVSLMLFINFIFVSIALVLLIAYSALNVN
ncbi:MAG: DUF3667 domain-containing protein [Flavobacterium sp.]|nr:DUF3667 domain-containing protein [Flavobacterium sp.]